ncbi:hypothetical protein V6Z12_A12G096000 [Gossypium hirsutum]
MILELREETNLKPYFHQSSSLSPCLIRFNSCLSPVPFPISLLMLALHMQELCPLDKSIHFSLTFLLQC